MALNLNCVACRAAKVKCDRGAPECSRCTRLSLACEYDKRRSRWDTQSTRPPTTLTDKPEYADLVRSIAKYKPGFSTHCYRDKLIDAINCLVEAAYLHDDADAISWATMQMHEHCIPLSKCKALQRAAHAVDPAPVLDTTLPAELAAVFDGDEPCMGWLCHGDRKAFVCNSAFPVDAGELATAQNLDEAADLIGVSRSAPETLPLATLPLAHANRLRCSPRRILAYRFAGPITRARCRFSMNLWQHSRRRWVVTHVQWRMHKSMPTYALTYYSHSFPSARRMPRRPPWRQMSAQSRCHLYWSACWSGIQAGPSHATGCSWRRSTSTCRTAEIGYVTAHRSVRRSDPCYLVF